MLHSLLVDIVTTWRKQQHLLLTFLVTCYDDYFPARALVMAGCRFNETRQTFRALHLFSCSLSLFFLLRKTNSLSLSAFSLAKCFLTWQCVLMGSLIMINKLSMSHTVDSEVYNQIHASPDSLLSCLTTAIDTKTYYLRINKTTIESLWLACSPENLIA